MTVAWWNAATPTRRAAVICMVLTAIELVLGLGFLIIKASPGVLPSGSLRFVNLDAERTPPALFSALQLWLLAGFAWACHRRRPRPGTRVSSYALAAVVALFLGMDEWLAWHERIREALKYVGLMDQEAKGPVPVGSFHVRSWTLVYLPLAVAVGALMARRFWRELPRDGSFTLLVVAALLFVGGAVGIEDLNAQGIAQGWYKAGDGIEYGFVFVEEMMEMFSVTLAVFVFARRWYSLSRNPVVVLAERTAST